MSAPPGFNPNASLLPDPGPSAAPIQVMRGGGKSTAQTGGAFSDAERSELQKYQLGPGGVIADIFDDDVKKEFLKQISDKSRCRRTTGDTVILGKDCWAIVKVIRALLNQKIKRGNSNTLDVSEPISETKEVKSSNASEPAVSEEIDTNIDLQTENVENLHEFTNTNLPSSETKEAETVEVVSNTASGEVEESKVEEETKSEKENVRNIEPPFTNSNKDALESFLKNNEPGSSESKPSPCKHRGKLQTKKNINNSSNTESIANEIRMEANTKMSKGVSRKTRKQSRK